MSRLVAMTLAFAVTAVPGLRKSRGAAAESQNVTVADRGSAYWGDINLGSRGEIQAKMKSNYTRLRYSPGIWDAYEYVFRNLPGDGCDDDLVWDLYSGKCWSFRINQCGQNNVQPRNEGDCYNREHSWPKSCWGGRVNDAYSDLFHVFPSDGFVNARRANYNLGNVRAASYTSSEGGKLGWCATDSINSILARTCFEPVDRVKGLLARAMFYFNLRYDGEIPAQVRNPRVMRDWHEAYPVTALEKEMNNRIQDLQGNRNPFIDNPDLVQWYF
jgi:endonuclease I